MPEHQSDILVISTVTMEILLKPTSSKLLVGDVKDSLWIELDYSLRQILHPNSLETIIQSSSNIIEHESSWIGVSGVSFLAFEIGSVCIRLYVESKAFFDSEIGQLSLNQKKQHVFNVLNAKPLEIAFFGFIEPVIISTHSDPILMLVVMPFDNLKFGNGDDSTFGVDISSIFPVDRKTIELLTFAPSMRDSPERLKLAQV
nr:hypothetical protein [Tanacetum cinerariifolium]